MLGTLGMLLGLGIFGAYDNYKCSKAYIYRKHPEILERNRQMREAQRKRNMATVETMAKVGVNIDIETGIDQTGKKWWYKTTIWDD